MTKDHMKEMREHCKKTKCEFCEDYYYLCSGKSFFKFCNKHKISGIPSYWKAKDINKGE